jgi:hypothetical protein
MMKGQEEHILCIGLTQNQICLSYIGINCRIYAILIGLIVVFIINIISKGDECRAVFSSAL